MITLLTFSSHGKANPLSLINAFIAPPKAPVSKTAPNSTSNGMAIYPLMCISAMNIGQQVGKLSPYPSLDLLYLTNFFKLFMTIILF